MMNYFKILLILFVVLKVLGCTPKSNPINRKEIPNKVDSIKFEEKIVFDLGEQYQIEKTLIKKINGKISLIAFASNQKSVIIFDSKGVFLDSINYQGDYIDLAVDEVTYDENVKKYIVLLSKNLDSIHVIFPRNLPNYIYKKDTLLDGKEWFEYQVNDKDVYEAYVPYYQLNYEQKYLLNTGFDVYRSAYMVDSIIYTVQTGSFYSRSLTDSKVLIKRHPKNVYISLNLMFWDQILYFNHSSGYLLYYAAQECSIYFDNVYDNEPAKKMSIRVNSYLINEAEYKHEVKIKHLGSFYDNKNSTLYLMDEYETGKVRLKTILFENLE